MEESVARSQNAHHEQNTLSRTHSVSLRSNAAPSSSSPVFYCISWQKHERHHVGVSMPRAVHANDRGAPFWLANRLHVRHFQLVHSLRNAASPPTLALRACKCAEDLTYGFWILESLPRAEPDGLTCRNSPARPARLSTRPRRVRILKMSPTRPFSLVPCTWPSPDEFDSDSDSESCARSSRACVFTSNAIVWQVGQLVLSLIVRCATKASLLSLG